MNVSATLTGDAPSSDLGQSTAEEAKAAIAFGARLSDGTAAGEADLMFSDSRTLLDGASEDLDLAGVLADALGDTVTAVRVKAIAVKAAVGNTTDLTVGAGTNAWATLLNAAGTVTLRPGAMFMAAVDDGDAVGWAVTAGTGDILAVANAAGDDADYEVIVIGASA